MIIKRDKTLKWRLVFVPCQKRDKLTSYSIRNSKKHLFLNQLLIIRKIQYLHPYFLLELTIDFIDRPPSLIKQIFSFIVICPEKLLYELDCREPLNWANLLIRNHKADLSCKGNFTNMDEFIIATLVLYFGLELAESLEFSHMGFENYTEKVRGWRYFNWVFERWNENHWVFRIFREFNQIANYLIFWISSFLWLHLSFNILYELELDLLFEVLDVHTNF